MLLKNIFTSRLPRYRVLVLAMAGSVLCGPAWAGKEQNASPVARSRLNDTGITWGGDYPKDINVDCSAGFNAEQIKEFEKLNQIIPGDPSTGDILSQQDCKHGRDVTANDNSDGAAGFVYRKVSSAGKVLDASAKSWDCVLDEISGLLWEVKKASDGVFGNRGLHDGDDLFTWYNPNVKLNGGLLGDWNSEQNQCAGYKAGQPATYCNIEEFSGRVNQQGLCGFKDWRVPTLMELATLVHYGRSDPAIDTAYFPHIKNEYYYWSNTPNASFVGTAWTLTFQFGQTASMRYTDSRPVILVRNWASKPVESAAK